MKKKEIKKVEHSKATIESVMNWLDIMMFIKNSIVELEEIFNKEPFFLDERYAEEFAWKRENFLREKNEFVKLENSYEKNEFINPKILEEYVKFFAELIKYTSSINEK